MEYSRNGYYGEDKAGEYELVGDGLVAAGTLSQYRGGGDGWDGALQNKEESDVVADIVALPDQDEQSQANERKDRIFNDDEFNNLPDI